MCSDLRFVFCRFVLQGKIAGTAMRAESFEFRFMLPLAQLHGREPSRC